jgi:hypothetical protein
MLVIKERAKNKSKKVVNGDIIIRHGVYYLVAQTASDSCQLITIGGENSKDFVNIGNRYTDKSFKNGMNFEEVIKFLNENTITGSWDNAKLIKNYDYTFAIDY